MIFSSRLQPFVTVVILCVQKNKMLSLAARVVDQLSSFYFPPATREKRHKKVSRNAELTDYAKNSAPDHQLFPLCMNVRRNARQHITKPTKSAPKAVQSRLLFWNEFHAPPSPASTLIYLPAAKKDQMKWDESTLEI